MNVTILADGTYTVNNVKISGENTMIKNGVVHYIDGVSHYILLVREILKLNKIANSTRVVVPSLDISRRCACAEDLGIASDCSCDCNFDFISGHGKLLTRWTDLIVKTSPEVSGNERGK